MQPSEASSSFTDLLDVEVEKVTSQIQPLEYTPPITLPNHHPHARSPITTTSTPESPPQSLPQSPPGSLPLPPTPTLPTPLPYILQVNDFYSERIEEAVIILHALRQHVDQANSLTPNSLTHNSITLSHVSHTTLSHSNASHTNTHFPHMSHSHVPPHVTLARIL